MPIGQKRVLVYRNKRGQFCKKRKTAAVERYYRDEFGHNIARKPAPEKPKIDPELVDAYEQAKSKIKAGREKVQGTKHHWETTTKIIDNAFEGTKILFENFSRAWEQAKHLKYSAYTIAFVGWNEDEDEYEPGFVSSAFWLPGDELIALDDIKARWGEYWTNKQAYPLVPVKIANCAVVSRSDPKQNRGKGYGHKCKGHIDTVDQASKGKSTKGRIRHRMQRKRKGGRVK